LPAFFAAQKAFNLADNFALAAGLIVFFFAFAVGFTEEVTGLARRRFAHLAFCVAAIFFLTEALMARFFFGAAPDVAGAPRIARRSLFRPSICSLIEAARFSWAGVRSSGFIFAIHTGKAALNQALTYGSQVQKISQRSWYCRLNVSIGSGRLGDHISAQELVQVFLQVSQMKQRSTDAGIARGSPPSILSALMTAVRQSLVVRIKKLN
jgi:hypothetical protein